MVPVGVGGINGTSYKVEYRLRSVTDASSFTSWMDALESPVDSSVAGTYLYYYETDTADMHLYDMVDWRVTTTAHSGTHPDTGASMISIDVEPPSRLHTFMHEDCEPQPLTAVVAYDPQP
jgi:hypothetical protein